MQLLSTLGPGETSRSFSCNSGWFVVSLVGTWNGNTIAMQMQPDPGANYAAHAVRENGVLTDQEFTDNESKGYVGHGQTFQFVDDNTGGSSVKIYVSGDGVALAPASS